MTAVVATSHPLAVEAASEMLQRGGSAADAAVAAGATLAVVDPRSTGIGGDVFALYWEAGGDRPNVLAGAGVSPRGLTLEALRAAGYTSMPIEGPWTVTVPGVPAAWAALVDRYGTLDLRQTLAPAIEHARGGFEVLPVVAEEWAMSSSTLRVSAAATDYFLPGGNPPSPGSRFDNPDLADVLEVIAGEGPAAFYQGEIAGRMAAAVQEAGGALTKTDLSGWGGPTWEEPVSSRYKGVDVFEAGPPGQGVIVLEALKLYEGFADLTADQRDHVAIECLKLAFEDAHTFVADPQLRSVDIDRLLDASRLDALRRTISMSAASIAYPERGSDTVYVAIVDHDGNCCSFIQSLYYGFGSGVGVPETGIVLQNRGAGFTFEDGHPNSPGPGKRPFHTIIPAMVGAASSPLAVLGVVGGYMQPQGQMQILRHLLEGRMSPQDSLDAPRFRVLDGRRVAVEDGFGRERIEVLTAKGHEITSLSRFHAGGAQLILIDEDGIPRGATDHRKDGVVGVLGD